MKKQKNTVKKFAEEMQMPESALHDTFSIEMQGNSEITIEGCKGMVEYDNSLIAMNLGSLIVRFHGNGLEISNFFEQQAVIKGTVISVEFSS